MGTRCLTRFLIVILFICAWQVSHAQILPTKIEQIDSLMAKQPKPILVLLSTDWCQYCAMQHRQIQRNKNFKQKSDHFYFVDFDAESKDKIKFQNKEYVYKPTGINIGTHELVFVMIGSNKISYPSWVLLDKQYQPIFRHNGLLNPQQLNELLDAIVETIKNK
ncbi:thioredoxin family protein [Sphingobacterium cavernae]|uniref:thioredoxin family protein n=1 Tax=Sphingobacterium cavernae TaxID=2592657 RepID=UPI001230130E|nr:thioredoxin fold domain-containing protein [Sphingobacterium cavernae]